MHVDRGYLHILAPAYAVLHAQEVGARVTNTGDAPRREKRQHGPQGESREASQEARAETEIHQPSPDRTLDIVV